MLNITNYKRNDSKNYNEISPHTSQNGHHQRLQTIDAGEGLKNGNPLALLVGMYIGIATMENSMEIH